MAKHLQYELDKLKQKLLGLCSEAETSVSKSIRSLLTADYELAQSVIDYDHKIDLSEVEVEEECLKILALYQPVAFDLRFVVVALKINNDLERIADLSVSIADRALYLKKLKPVEVPFDLEGMANKTRAMLKKAIDSLVELDSEAAKDVCVSDSEVDEIHRGMYDRIYETIRANPENVEQLIHYLSISRCVERIADFATNIAEDVIYMTDGKIVRHL